LVFEILEDRVDLPAVAVRVGQPELLLERIAAGLALLLLRDDPARPQVGPPAEDLVHGGDSDAEVGQRSGRPGPSESGLQREVDRRVFADELRVVGLALLRLAEESRVEGDGLVEIRDVQGDVHRTGHGYSCSGGIEGLRSIRTNLFQTAFASSAARRP